MNFNVLSIITNKAAKFVSAFEFTALPSSSSSSSNSHQAYRVSLSRSQNKSISEVNLTTTLDLSIKTELFRQITSPISPKFPLCLSSSKTEHFREKTSPIYQKNRSFSQEAFSSMQPKPARWNPLSISLVVTVCIVFIVYSYKLLKQCRRNDQVQRRLLNETENNHDNGDPAQVRRQGLDFSIIHSIPMIQFKKTKNENQEEETTSQTNNSSTEDCAVCLGEFEEGEWLRCLPRCCHLFHVSCIDVWFQTHSNCPLCRSSVYEDLTTQDNHNLHEYAVSVYTLLETLGREEGFIQERAARRAVWDSFELCN